MTHKKAPGWLAASTEAGNVNIRLPSYRCSPVFGQPSLDCRRCGGLHPIGEIVDEILKRCDLLRRWI